MVGVMFKDTVAKNHNTRLLLFMLVQLALALLLALCAMPALAQKTAYIPAYIRDTNTVEGRQFRVDHTAQSQNFLLIWGTGVGSDPTQAANEALRFDPQQVLDTLEYVYTRCKELGLVNDAPGTKASRYKFVVVMYNTWGPGGPEGWANGWAVDDTIGAFWVHPQATRTGIVTAHEFTHSLQAMYHIDELNPHRGSKAIFDNIGLFYETHANYVRNVLYPNAVTSDIDAHKNIMLEPDWKFNYEGYHFLLHVHQELGMDMVSRLWSEWRPNEVPLQTLRHIMQLENDQSAFNDFMMKYAIRGATWDYDTLQWGVYLKQSRQERLRATWGRQFAQRTFDVLRRLSDSSDIFYTPDYLAPQDYGYNVVRLFPKQALQPVSIRFHGHTEVNSHAGWRYAVIQIAKDGSVVWQSPIESSAQGNIMVSPRPSVHETMLIVMGAPVDSMHANSEQTTWNGNPKRYHYPWHITLDNAVPEGFQDPREFRPWLRSPNGSAHANGGGWVDASARVDASVFVGLHASVIGSSIVRGNAKIVDQSVVIDAQISDNVTVSGNAFVIGGEYSNTVTVTDNCFAVNNTASGNALLAGASMVSNYSLSGSVRIFGDLVVYNQEGSCNNGEYHVLTQYYRNDTLPCDGRDANHPQNVSVNRPIDFAIASVTIPTDEAGKMHIGSVYPLPATKGGTLHITGIANASWVRVQTMHGQYIGTFDVGVESSSSVTMPIPQGLSAGRYILRFSDNANNVVGVATAIIVR